MPTRQSLGGRIGGGVFEGLESFGGTMMQSALADRASRRVSARELFKDYTDKVMKGDLDPDQAERAMGMQGIPVPKGYFHSLQPSIQSGLDKIVGGISKAETPQTVPGVTALASSEPVRRLPMKTGAFASPSQQPDESAPPTLASTQYQPFSPEFDQLLKVRNEKLDAFPPQRVDSVDANGIKQTTFESSRPDKLTGRSFQTEPTGIQAGAQAALKNVTQQRNENAQGLPQLKGDAFTAQETVERPAKVETAGQMSTRTAQAALDVQTNPANVVKEARKAAAIEDATTRARDIAQRANIPPEIAMNFIGSTATGRNYAYIPADIPALERRVAVDALVKPSPQNPQGVKIVNKDQAAALQALDKARTDYDDLMNRLEGHLAKSAAGRPVTSLTNTIGTYAQSDPELVAALATSFPQIIQNLKANAGTVGRIMQIELEGMAKSIPQATDTWRTAQLKQMAEFVKFQNAEDAILGRRMQAK